MRSRFIYAQLQQDDRSLNHLAAEPWDGLFRNGPNNGRAALENRQFSCFLAVFTAGMASGRGPRVWLSNRIPDPIVEDFAPLRQAKERFGDSRA